MQNYETRKKFEAAIQSIALLHGIDKQQLRNEIRVYLFDKGLIKLSTKELNAQDFDYIAECLSKLSKRMAHTPPNERAATLDYAKIIPFPNPK